MKERELETRTKNSRESQTKKFFARIIDSFPQMLIILLFVENCLKYNAIYDFSVWLRTGSNPRNINRFRSTIV